VQLLDHSIADQRVFLSELVALREGKHRRHTSRLAVAELSGQWHLNDILHSQLVGNYLSVAVSEDGGIGCAVGAHMVGHVLNNGQHPYPQILEHCYSFKHVEEG
jgi:hypothetical protein